MIRFCHGFNVRDGGQRSLGDLATEYSRQLQMPALLFNWGWSRVTTVRFRTGGAIDDFIQRQRENPARVWVGHSHGCHIICTAYRSLPDDVEPPEALVLIQPAMNVNYRLPFVPILVRYNPHDLAVKLGQIWRRVNPVSWFWRHPWGAAGRYGFDNPTRLTRQVDTSVKTHGQSAYRGHSVDGGSPEYWGEHDAQWIKSIR